MFRDIYGSTCTSSLKKTPVNSAYDINDQPQRKEHMSQKINCTVNLRATSFVYICTASESRKHIYFVPEIKPDGGICATVVFSIVFSKDYCLNEHSICEAALFSRFRRHRETERDREWLHSLISNSSKKLLTICVHLNISVN